MCSARRARAVAATGPGKRLSSESLRRKMTNSAVVNALGRDLVSRLMLAVRACRAAMGSSWRCA